MAKVYELSLDKLTEVVEDCQGVALNEAGAGSTLFVTTNTCTYTIHIIDPGKGEVLVSGGKFSIEPAHCKLCGSTLGSMLVTGRVIVGFFLEFFLLSGEKLITPIVRSVSILPESDHLAS